MIRGTTPTFILKLKNKDGTPSTIDLSEANSVYFTIAQGGKTITKIKFQDALRSTYRLGGRK